MQLDILTIAMTYRKIVGVQWGYIDPDAATITGDVTYTLYRSGSPNGPWDVVAASIDTTVFEDTLDSGVSEKNILDARREIWYKVAMYVDGVLHIESPPCDDEGNVAVRVEHVQAIGLVGKHRETSVQNRNVFMRSPAQSRRHVYVQRLVTRRSLIALHRFNGTQLTLFKRRWWGPFCETCLDPVTRTVLMAECPECYGTGRSGGYYTPIEFLGKLDTQPPQTDVTEQGQTRVTQAVVQSIQYPKVAKGDVIYTHDSGRFWEIVQISPALSLQGRDLTQSFVISELSPTRSIYNIEVPNPRLTWEQTTR